MCFLCLICSFFCRSLRQGRDVSYFIRPQTIMARLAYSFNFLIAIVRGPGYSSNGRGWSVQYICNHRWPWTFDPSVSISYLSWGYRPVPPCPVYAILGIAYYIWLVCACYTFYDWATLPALKNHFNFLENINQLCILVSSQVVWNWVSINVTANHQRVQNCSPGRSLRFSRRVTLAFQWSQVSQAEGRRDYLGSLNLLEHSL